MVAKANAKASLCSSLILSVAFISTTHGFLLSVCASEMPEAWRHIACSRMGGGRKR